MTVQPNPSTQGRCSGRTSARYSVLHALRRGIPLDTFAVDGAAREARTDAARIGDRIAASLEGCEVHARDHMRTVAVCPLCGGPHELQGTEYDRGSVDERGHVRVVYPCWTHRIEHGGDLVEVDAEAVARSRVLAYRLPTGAILHVEQPRWLLESWEADPARLQRGLLKCSRDAVVRKRANGGLQAVPCGCGGGMCPRCTHQKAARRVGKWSPFFDELAAAGAPMVHVTLTQVADQHTGPEMPTEGQERAAVSGECLGAAMERFRTAWTAMRDSRRTRDRFRSSVAGYVYGIESTGRSPEGRLRYHVHGHALMALSPDALHDAVWGRYVPHCVCGGRHSVTLWQDVTDEASGETVMRYYCPTKGGMVTTGKATPTITGGSWWDWWVSEWTRLSGGASAQGQVAHGLGGTDEDRLKVLREVLKYPFKPAEFTTAQTLEWAATVKGRCLHLSGGCLHPSSNLRKAAAGDDTARERLTPAMETLIAPLQRALARLEAEELDAKTMPVEVELAQGPLPVWGVATVRTLLDVDARTAGQGVWLRTAEDPDGQKWSAPELWAVDELLELFARPKDPPSAKKRH